MAERKSESEGATSAHTSESVGDKARPRPTARKAKAAPKKAKLQPLCSVHGVRGCDMHERKE